VCSWMAIAKMGNHLTVRRDHSWVDDSSRALHISVGGKSAMLKMAKVGLQKLLGSVGYRMVRLNGLPEGRRAMMIRHQGIETVVDIGANTGQYGSDLRETGYSGSIISFEPTTRAYEKLAARARKDPSWIVKNCAIGEANGEATIHVAANGAASSSLLPMLALLEECAPDAHYIAEERVQVKTLDTALEGLLKADDRVFLKIDSQGYEDRILNGALNVLTQVKLLECELSFVPLYDGQILFEKMLTLIMEKGFSPAQFTPEFADPNTGQSLQINGIFVRSTGRSHL